MTGRWKNNRGAEEKRQGAEQNDSAAPRRLGLARTLSTWYVVTIYLSRSYSKYVLDSSTQWHQVVAGTETRQEGKQQWTFQA